MKHDLLSDTLSIINNAEAVGKKTCQVPASKFIGSVLNVIKDSGYISSISMDKEKNTFTAGLVGKINRIKCIKPRFSVKKNEFDRWERRYLPAKGMGILIVSTPMGVMNQKQAIEKRVGGKLLGFVY